MGYATPLMALIAVVTLGTWSAGAEGDEQLAMAIGEPGSDSFAFGTELWAMSQITLMPEHGIVVTSHEVTDDEDRLSLLQKRNVEAALVYGRVPEASRDPEASRGNVRAIMALWPNGVRSGTADPVRVLVHKDVADDVIYRVTKAMFEHGNYFRLSHARLGIGEPSMAIQGLDMPLHDGADRYYRERGVRLEPTVVVAKNARMTKKVGVAENAGDERASLSAVYRDFDDAALEPGEVDQIAAACRQALEAGSLLAVLGDLDHTGCEAYRDRLTITAPANVVPARADNADRRAIRPPEAIAASPQNSLSERTALGLFDSAVGQGGPAVRWVPSDHAEEAARPSVSTTMPSSVIRQPTM